MKKLTLEIAKRDIGNLREHRDNPKTGLSIREELYLQALERSIPSLEEDELQQQGKSKKGGGF